jgi:hypothetical protein
MHSDDAANPDQFDTADQIVTKYEAVDGVNEAHAVVEQHPAVSGGFVMIHPGAGAKAGRVFSAANHGKLQMATDHLDHAVAMGEKAFHPVAHTCVKAAHGILHEMMDNYGKPAGKPGDDNDEDDKGFTMSAPQEKPDQVNGGAIRFDGAPVQTIGSGHQYNAGQMFSAPKDQQQPPGNSSVATNAQAGIAPGVNDLFSGVPTDTGPGGGKEFRQPQMPQMFDINRDESTGEVIGERAIASKFNWDVVSATLIFMAGESPEKAAALHKILGERLKEIQKKNDLDLVCEQLFA